MPQSGIGSAQLTRNVRMLLGETAHVRFVNHRAVERDGRPFDAAPIKTVIDDFCAPGGRPRARNTSRVRIQEKFLGSKRISG